MQRACRPTIVSKMSGSLSLSLSHVCRAPGCGCCRLACCVNRREKCAFPDGFPRRVTIPRVSVCDCTPHLKLKGKYPLAAATGTDEVSRIEYPRVGHSSFLAESVRCFATSPPHSLPFRKSLLQIELQSAGAGPVISGSALFFLGDTQSPRSTWWSMK